MSYPGSSVSSAASLAPLPAKHAAAWRTRQEGLDQLEEYAVVTPYVDLPGVEYWDAQRRERDSDLFSDYFRRSVKELAAPK
jgi:hypothetical protein